MKDNLTIVDGNYLMVRAVMANPHLMSSIGEPTGGIFIFLKSLNALIKDSKETIICFDGGHNSIRKEVYPEYKSNRNKKSEEEMTQAEKDSKKALEFSFTHIVPLLRKIGLTTVRIDGEEADDVIYAYAKHFSNEYSVTVSSDDSDYLQMIDDSIRIYRPLKDDYITKSNFKLAFGYDVKYHVLYKSIIGDKSDNILNPCKGLGEVTARKIIAWLEENNLDPTPENVMKFLTLESSQKKAVFKRFAEPENFKNLKRNLFLIDISRIASDEKCSDYLRELTIAKELIDPDPEFIMKTFHRYEIKSLPQWIMYSKMKYESLNK